MSLPLQTCPTLAGSRVPCAALACNDFPCSYCGLGGPTDDEQREAFRSSPPAFLLVSAKNKDL